MALTEEVVPASTRSFSGLVASNVDEPIPTFPEAEIRVLSLLLVYTTKSTLSVLPIKFVPAVVPEFPMVFQALRLEAEFNRAIQAVPFQ